MKKAKDPEWVTVTIGEKQMRLTAHIEPMKGMKDRVVVVFDAPRDFVIKRDNMKPKREIDGNAL